MKILAIDTSGQTASAALIEDEKLIGEFTQNDKLTHSQTILPMVAEICEKTNTDPKDVDYIADQIAKEIDAAFIMAEQNIIKENE